METSPSPLMGPAEIAEALGISKRTVIDDIHGGLLRAEKIGNNFAIKRADGQAYIDGRRTYLELQRQADEALAAFRENMRARATRRNRHA